jgi:carboxypeptidase T
MLMKYTRKWIITAVIIISGTLVSALLLGARLVSQASNQPDLGPPSLSEAMQLISEPSDWSVIRLYFNDRDHLNQVAGELDIWEVQKEDGYVLAAVSPEQYRWLEVSGYRLEIDTEKTAIIQAPLAPLDPRFHYFDNYYPNANELYVVDFLTETNQAYPDLTELLDIGDAWLASHGEHPRDMWVLRITNEDPAYGDIADKPVFFLFATIHAREVAVPELAIRYIKYLTSGFNEEGGYGIDADATWLVNHNVLYVLVMQNPDGHWINEQDWGAYRRKNMDNDDGCNDPNQWGVDLNRNSSFLWGCCGGSSGLPCSETYRGPSAGSEPETQAFQQFFATVVPDQNGPNGDNEIAPASPLTTTGIFISMHSYSDLVLWPWGFDNYGDPPNYAQLQTIGRKFADFTNYDPSGTIWYDVDGATDDWTYGKFGIASYTFEVGPSSGSCGGFFPAYDCIDGAPGYPENFWAENKPAFLYAHKIARTPYMTAYGPDAQDLTTFPEDAYRGQPVQLSATIRDNRYGGDPLAPIYGAEYFVDTPGEDGTGIPLSPTDGNWGGLIEEVSAILDTSDMGEGQHYILIHGQNDDGDWGPFSAVFLTITVPDYGVALYPESDAKQADPGEVVTYTLQVLNYGANDDTYDITLGSIWAADVPTVIGPLTGGESTSFGISVTIPLSATNGESDTATVQIQSQGDPTITDTASLETTANYYNLSLITEQDQQYGLPGTGVIYNLEVTNQGNSSDVFDITISGTWTITAPVLIGPLDAGQSAAFDVSVHIPNTTLPGESDLSTITLTSQGDETKYAFTELTTTAGVLGPLVSPIEMTAYGDPGADIVYTLTITNAGETLDNFNINISDALWDTIAPATSGWIPIGESRDIQVTVSIPEEAADGDSDTALIEISSLKPNVVPVSASLTTLAARPYALDVVAETDTLVASQAGDSVTFMLNLTNLGGAADTYDLSASSDWTVLLPETVGPLASGETAVVAVTVFVPVDAHPGDVNTTTVTVTSQNDPQVTGQVVLTTRLQVYQVYLPISFKP